MLIPYAPEALAVEVCDRQFADTRYKQKAFWLNTNIARHPVTHETRVTLELQVVPYAADAAAPDGFGPVLNGFGIAPYPVSLYANNNCAVYFNPQDPGDPRNGEIVLDGTFRIASEWDAELEAHPDPLIKQGNFFAILMDYPQVLNQMVVNEINRANQAPHFKFGVPYKPAPGA